MHQFFHFFHKIYNSSLCRLLLMTLWLSWLSHFTVGVSLPFSFSELIKKVQFGSLDLIHNQNDFVFQLHLPVQWHMHRLPPFLTTPRSPQRSSVKSFLRAVSSFLRWLEVGASWCHHLVGEAPRVPRVFRKSSRGSEMLAPSSVLERNNGSISPIPSILSHRIHLP